MVGAAGYVCGLKEPRQAPPETLGRPDIRWQMAAKRRADLLRVLSRDSLTPVITQMILSDLPAVFSPARQSDDRGRVLERVWEERVAGNDRNVEVAGSPARGAGDGLGVEFSTLAPGERDGWRPSLIISPMILEGNDRLLITNLNLEGMADGLEFFRHFHNAHLKVSTALRMNAAFPYVTPAVKLPTNPPRRVIDAGYRENYGVDLAAEWIKKHHRWLADNTSGVILIQIRAYPQGAVGQITDEEDDAGSIPPSDDAGLLATFEAKVGIAIQGLTSPLEGVMSVNRGTMIAINRQKVDRIKTLFNETRRSEGHDPNLQGPGQEGQLPAFRTFVFTSTAMSPLSWTLTARDKEQLEKALHSPENEQRFNQVEQLLKE
jgi:hypothetical protein